MKFLYLLLTVLLNTAGNISLKYGTNYIDTLTNLNGCYKIYVSDVGEEGFSWWANPNDGDGYIRVRPPNGGSLKTIATDFGKFVEYNFVAGELSSLNNPIEDRFLVVFPNPSRDLINILAEGFEKEIDAGFIYKISIDNEESYDFKYFRIVGDRKYTFKGLLGSINKDLKEVEKVFDAVQPR